MKVIFSNRAYLAIITETAEKIKTETGGVFLGCYEKGNWYVIEAIDPGPESVFQVAYFEYDRKYTEHLINKIARMYHAKLTLIGLWHRHPGSFDKFSPTDSGTNSEYARLSPNGAISALVNIDPKFRLTPYLVTWPLKYTKIIHKIGDDLIPENLLRLKKSDEALEHIINYANKSNKKTVKPKMDLARLLEGIKAKFQPVSLGERKFTAFTKHGDLLIDSLLDDISYLSETRGLALNVEQNTGSLCLSHRGANDIVTKLCFVYDDKDKRIVFSYNDICYEYTSGLFANLMADYVSASSAFKDGLKLEIGIGKKNPEEENEQNTD